MKERKEHPILFDAESMRAILAGRKTQTRRLVKPQPFVAPANGFSWEWVGPAKRRAGGASEEECRQSLIPHCPYGQPGDHLWVRETWAETLDEQGYGCVAYRADGQRRRILYSYGGDGDPEALGAVVPQALVWDDLRVRWRASIHMPRWASRVNLKVVAVRPERLQDISEGDAEAEGVEAAVAEPPNESFRSYKITFADRWDALNAKRGYPWASNRWVWVVEFARLDMEG